jgi:hypothetical protein
MHDALPPLTQLDDDRPVEPSLVDEVRQLIDDGRTFVEAEIAFQTSRAAYAGKGIKGVILFGALAAVLVFFALMALTVGLVIALMPVLTAWGATAAVFAGFLIIAGICGMKAASCWKLIIRHVAGKDGEV